MVTGRYTHNQLFALFVLGTGQKIKLPRLSDAAVRQTVKKQRQDRSFASLRILPAGSRFRSRPQTGSTRNRSRPANGLVR